MRKVNSSLALVVAAMAVTVSAWAVPVPVSLTRYPGYYSGTGGEFTVLNSPWANPSLYDHVVLVEGGFQSFCLETDEYTSGIKWADLSLTAIRGGSGGPEPDPISVGTAWLYKEFAKGKLQGYKYDKGPDREESAKYLQQTIWWLEDEKVPEPSGNPFYGLVLNKFGSLDDARADYNPATHGYGVAVVNMYGSLQDGKIDWNAYKQDMLVLVADGGLTLVMLGIGLVVLAAIRRRA
ncbi:MAG: hypothetical protein QHJ82_05290 [Verrucomicrobiota bacterium]|nr:hypothetical protein [Verrucomicrobiota bacterium]